MVTAADAVDDTEEKHTNENDNILFSCNMIFSISHNMTFLLVLCNKFMKLLFQLWGIIY